MAKDVEEAVRPLQMIPEMTPMSTIATDYRQRMTVATATTEEAAQAATTDERAMPGLKIGTDPRNLPEIKGLKATKLPDPYEGAVDIATFEGWVQSLLSWFQLARMTGQKADASRLDVMQLCLKGPAKEWFGQEVLSPDRAIQKWTFRGAVLAMHRRFVHEATAQQATDQFHALHYDHKTGATAFFNGLWERASRMVQ
ncbi:hypothetical protein BV22DRAFT_1052796 [Leucogyrophana mollusca]|uniref:Uncharacterized protein n=1 Tax=Leucogyrophana mollusca TaxID=85980 RepID=A0ACB8AVF7_9AGAM|nr:hypothetical protein BV22DRAFT_1052796 [Leucogyrophana mollusca]